MKYSLKALLCGKTEKNKSAVLRAAVERMQDGDTLCLDGETLELYPEGAAVRSYYISNNDSGEKSIAFPLVGKQHITVDGGGARLLLHGRIMPFVIDGCEDVTIRDLFIDYAAPFYAQADIVEADEHHTVLQFDNKEFFCRVKDGNFCFYSPTDGWEDTVDKCLTMEFDREKAAPAPYAVQYFPYTGAGDDSFLRFMYRDVTLEEQATGRIVMHGDLGFTHTVGNVWVCTHSSREFPGIFITGSRGVVLEDVTMYHTASMGVIAQISENIALRRVQAVPRPGSGRMLSVNADATHFVNCRGSIELTDCKFVSMMDDALNIHGIYNRVQKKLSENTLLLDFGHFQQYGVQIYRPGDTVTVFDSDTMRERVRGKVVSAELLNEKEIRLQLDCAVPQPGPHDLTENISTAPDITIRGTESGYNRPRGFLLSTAGKTVVEDCTFYNISCGIQFGCDMVDWYESGAVQDVTIRGNRFHNSAYTGGPALLVAPRLRVRTPEEPFNGRVVIENNSFIQHEPRLLQAKSIRELVFRGNTFHADASLPAQPPIGKDGVSIEACVEVEYEPAVEC